MKTNFKILASSFITNGTLIILSFLALLLMTSFGVKNEVQNTEDDEYIFVIAYPGANSNTSNTNYISGIIHYAGYDACPDYNYSTAFFGEAGQEFMNTVERNHNVDISQWRIEYYDKYGNGSSYPSGYFKGYSSKGQAEATKKKKVQEIENRSSGPNKAYETWFTYSCN